jgi:hypothetical protein
MFILWFRGHEYLIQIVLFRHNKLGKSQNEKAGKRQEMISISAVRDDVNFQILHIILKPGFCNRRYPKGLI